jgi:hypothetical protein
MASEFEPVGRTSPCVMVLDAHSSFIPTVRADQQKAETRQVVGRARNQKRSDGLLVPMKWKAND